MTHRWCSRAAATVVLATVAFCWAGCRPGKVEAAGLTPEVAAKLAGKHWYRVSVMGQPSGWAFFDTWSRKGDDGKLELVSRQRMFFNLTLNGMKLTASQEMTVETDNLLRPVRITVVADELGRAKNVKAEVQGDKLHVEVEGGGRTFTKDLDLPEDWGSDLQLARDAAMGKLKPGRELTASIFDPELAAFDRHHLKVVGWTDVEVAGETRHLLQVDDKTERLKLSITTYLDEQGVVWLQKVPGILNMTMEKVPEEEAKKVGSPLSLTNKVEIDKPLGDPRVLKLVVLKAQFTQAPDTQPVPTTARQKVEKLAPDSYKITLRANPKPTKIAAYPLEVPEELAPLTKATSIAQADDPQIKAKAKEIVAGSKDCWEAAQAIVKWVYENVQKVASEPKPVTGAEVFQSMRGDCSEHAVLAGTLARAAGLPSKMCVGLGCTGQAFYYHAWVKIWVGEWVEMDPTWGEPLVDASHLELGEGALDEVSLARMSLATARIIGQVSFDVLKVERSE
ncbi:MAG: transglutaminase domain-containing protein [Armatimonadetes bacterium]|nr:transglutaminase domain-containing protein [Armatimonadota bacterium]